jgi:hypothetical protein
MARRPNSLHTLFRESVLYATFKWEFPENIWKIRLFSRNEGLFAERAEVKARGGEHVGDG